MRYSLSQTSKVFWECVTLIYKQLWHCKTEFLSLVIRYNAAELCLVLQKELCRITMYTALPFKEPRLVVLHCFVYCFVLFFCLLLYLYHPWDKNVLLCILTEIYMYSWFIECISFSRKVKNCVLHEFVCVKYFYTLVEKKKKKKKGEF